MGTNIYWIYWLMQKIESLQTEIRSLKNEVIPPTQKKVTYSIA